MDVADDGLFCSPPIGKWAEDKHNLVSLYAKLFSTGMKEKWEERVYIELYAGAGYAKIQHSTRTIAGSPIQALLLEDPFDKYIFCEKYIYIIALYTQLNSSIQEYHCTSCSLFLTLYLE